MSNLTQRLAKVEAGRRDRLNTGRLIVMRRDPDEPDAAAIARWCASHPGEPPPSEDDNTIFIVRTIVDPVGAPRQ